VARYVDVWRQNLAAIRSHAKAEGGKMLYPHMYSDDGPGCDGTPQWCDFQDTPMAIGAVNVRADFPPVSRGV
jgi:hypothetical protein